MSFFPGHKAGKWQGWDSNPDSQIQICNVQSLTWKNSQSEAYLQTWSIDILPLYLNYTNRLNTQLEKYGNENWQITECWICVDVPSRLKPDSASDDVGVVRKEVSQSKLHLKRRWREQFTHCLLTWQATAAVSVCPCTHVHARVWMDMCLLENTPLGSPSLFTRHLTDSLELHAWQWMSNFALVKE